MGGNPATKQEQGCAHESTAAVPRSIGVLHRPEEHGGSRLEEEGASEEKNCTGSCESCSCQDQTSGDHTASQPAKEAPDKQASKGPLGHGEAQSGRQGLSDQHIGPNGCGASGEMPGSGNPGAGPWQPGYGPGPDPQYGPYMSDPGFSGMPHGAGPYGASHHPGNFGNAPFGQPMGGPPPWMHPGPGYHPGCHGYHGAMYGYPPQGPEYGFGGGPGAGYGGPPPRSDRGEQNFGHMADIFGKAMQGQATPQDVVTGLLNLNFHDDQFWKGVVVGSVAALLLNSDSVRQTLTGALGGLFGKSGE